MEVAEFLELAQKLTGTPTKDVSETDKSFLDEALRDDTRELECSQFNELLLLVNKDRVEVPFYRYFFGERCAVSGLASGIERFQKAAMLLYGNFIYAFRTLSVLATDEEFRGELGRFAMTETDIVAKHKGRSRKVIEIELIPKENTHFVGYLSPAVIIAENERSQILKKCFDSDQLNANSSWNDVESVVQSVSNPREHDALLTIVRNFQQCNPDEDPSGFGNYLDTVTPQFDQQKAEIEEVRRVATRNQDVYLTWDHMDVYFATSMRERWEYESLFDFVQELMAREELAELNLRYFDPTQSYTTNRINKGLVEALMLKRSKCTVYSVQDTDTLGKDSELAATLAQGKPVIAYVPAIQPIKRANELRQQNPSTIQQRLRFVAHAADLSQDDIQFAANFRALDDYDHGRIWRSIVDSDAVEAFHRDHAKDIERLCRIIADAEKRLYDKRARTLAETHPLGVQVHLETGVANGVLVVRSIDKCAELLRRVLTNSLNFTVEVNDNDKMWYLRERISGCVYRVVSSDRKLTNCFWNFYRREERI